MFKESKNLFNYFESLPAGRKKPKLSFEGIKKYNGPEIPREIREKEKKEQEDNVRVAEKLLHNLELHGVKCPRCGLKNVSEIGIVLPDKRMLYCLDCRWKWEV